MIHLEKLRDLTLNKVYQEHRHMHLNAASGLVKVGDFLYVVADDENHLGIFHATSSEPGKLKRLFAGELPVEPEQRKAKKPDMEAITLLPGSEKYPNGALLALGSGSKKLRHQGVIIELDKHGAIQHEPDIIDLKPLYDLLEEAFEKVNIEGAAVVDEQLFLFQRGNSKNCRNAIVALKMKSFFKLIAKKDNKIELKITDYDLGKINEVPLTFTDATALPNGAILFTAAAENTLDPVLDGVCEGSAVGIIQPDGVLFKLWNLQPVVKVEGVAAQLQGSKIQLLMVTDADNEAIPAALYRAELDGYPFNN